MEQSHSRRGYDRHRVHQSVSSVSMYCSAAVQCRRPLYSVKSVNYCPVLGLTIAQSEGAAHRPARPPPLWPWFIKRWTFR